MSSEVRPDGAELSGAGRTASERHGQNVIFLTSVVPSADASSSTGFTLPPHAVPQPDEGAVSGSKQPVDSIVAQASDSGVKARVDDSHVEQEADSEIEQDFVVDPDFSTWSSKPLREREPSPCPSASSSAVPQLDLKKQASPGAPDTSEEGSVGSKGSKGSSCGGSWFGRKMGKTSSRSKAFTAEEVESLKDDFKRRISTAERALQAHTHTLVLEVRREVADHLVDLRSERQILLLAQEDVRASLEDTVQELKQRIRDLEDKFAARVGTQVEDALRSSHDRDLATLQKSIQRETQSLRAQLWSELSDEVAEKISSRVAPVTAKLDCLHGEHLLAVSQLQAQASELRSRAQQDVKAVEAKLEARQDYAQSELNEESKRQLAAVAARLTDSEAVLADVNKDKVSHSEVQEQLSTLSLATESRCASLDEQIRSLRTCVAEVENIPTRRIEWQLPNIHELLQTASSETASFFSPEFEAAGTHGLQLELRLLPPEDKDLVPEECSATSSWEDCELLLWADNCDLSMLLKMCVGNTYVDLQHCFLSLQPCTSGRIPLKEQLYEEEGMLSLSVEILEAVREVQLPSRLASSAETGSDAADAAKAYPWRKMEGSVVSHRHLVHRTLDLVQNQVDLMRARMVRRVEWRIERASELQRCFPAGQCLYSAPFDAGGLEGLQFLFYPSGNEDARDGCCSLYVSCRTTSKLHCWLWIGKQRWEVSGSHELAHEQFGRASFCRFDGCIDERDDTLLVAFELKEAVQDVAIPSAAQRPWSPGGAVRHGGPIESTVHVRRQANTSGLHEVKRLPSIWTEKPAADEAAEKQGDGYHTFAEMRAVKRPHSGRPSRRPASGTRCRKVPPRPLSCAGDASQGPSWLAASLGGQIGIPASNRYQMYAR